MPPRQYLLMVTVALLIPALELIPLPAIQRHSIALAKTPASQDRKVEADRLLNQGIQQFNHSQHQAALQSWQQALDLYRKVGDRQGEANSLQNLGSAYSSLRQYAKAVEALQQALRFNCSIIYQQLSASWVTFLKR